MTDHDLQSIRRPVTSDTTDEELAAINQVLETLDASARIRWALEYLPGNHIVSSSFGAQSAVMLHLLTQAKPDIPVVLTDTGYLFPENVPVCRRTGRAAQAQLKGVSQRYLTRLARGAFRPLVGTGD